MSSTLERVTRLLPVCCCVWLLVTAACGAVQRPDGGSGLMTAGSAVTPLRGRDQHGNVVELDFPTPHLTVVYFYPRDSTPGCTKEACAFRDVWRRFSERGITVIGVSSDDAESHRAFTREHRLPFALIADEDGRWARAFGVPGLAGFYSRVTFLVGRDGRVLKTYEAVDPGLHANQILTDAERLVPERSSQPSARTMGSRDALLAPAPRLTEPPAPTVGLGLQLVADPRTPTVLWLAAELTPPSEAHLSWHHMGESGLPTTVEFFGPPGYELGPPRYPAPTRLPTAAGRTALGYTGPFAVLARVEVKTGTPLPDPRHPETFAVFQVHGTWLSCDTRCTKEEVHQTLKWNGSAVTHSALSEWLRHLPATDPPKDLTARLIRKNSAIELTSPADWELEDAFLSADVAPGSRLATFTRVADGLYRLAPVPQPAPAFVVIKARVTGVESRYFEVSVTDE